MARSLRGHFLVAGRRLRDSNFFQSIVLLVEHNSEGAMGLVVNRPTETTVHEALSGHFDLPESDELVYWGGPVTEDALFILHNVAAADSNEAALVPGLYVGSSAEAFADVVRRMIQGEDGANFRVFRGCAGWSAGQLEGEISRSDWLICPAVGEVVFHPDPYAAWQDVCENIRTSNPLKEGVANDPRWN